MNKWKEIWSNRISNDNLLSSNSSEKDIFLELKRIDGFDGIGSTLTYEALIKQYNMIKQRLIEDAYNYSKVNGNINTVFEVGCGSGANLFLLENEGYKVGGIDYSDKLISVASKVLETKDLVCDEAINLDIEPTYDVILSNSVFSYFQSVDYAWEVLEKITKKANYSLGLIDLHDEEKKDDFIAFRRKEVPNYDELYKDLSKQFYSKEFFKEFAHDNNLNIVFTESDIPGYWNNDYIFNCFMYKNDNVKVKKISK